MSWRLASADIAWQILCWVSDCYRREDIADEERRAAAIRVAKRLFFLTIDYPRSAFLVWPVLNWWFAHTAISFLDLMKIPIAGGPPDILD